MKQVLTNIIEITFIIFLVFLFQGDPDVFDSLRAKLMKPDVECSKPSVGQTSEPQMK